jgi:hypothetical protein
MMKILTSSSRVGRMYMFEKVFGSRHFLSKVDLIYLKGVAGSTAAFKDFSLIAFFMVIMKVL